MTPFDEIIYKAEPANSLLNDLDCAIAYAKRHGSVPKAIRLEPDMYLKFVHELCFLLGKNKVMVFDLLKDGNENLVYHGIEVEMVMVTCSPPSKQE